VAGFQPKIKLCRKDGKELGKLEKISSNISGKQVFKRTYLESFWFSRSIGQFSQTVIPYLSCWGSWRGRRWPTSWRWSSDRWGVWRRRAAIHQRPDRNLHSQSTKFWTRWNSWKTDIKVYFQFCKHTTIIPS
jgi:hypothetical protein